MYYFIRVATAAANLIW